MLVQSAIHFALDYVIQSACRYFEVSISSNKVWGTSELQSVTVKILDRTLLAKTRNDHKYNTIRT